MEMYNLSLTEVPEAWWLSEFGTVALELLVLARLMAWWLLQTPLPLVLQKLEFWANRWQEEWDYTGKGVELAAPVAPGCPSPPIPPLFPCSLPNRMPLEIAWSFAQDSIHMSKRKYFYLDIYNMARHITSEAKFLIFKIFSEKRQPYFQKM